VDHGRTVDKSSTPHPSTCLGTRCLCRCPSVTPTIPRSGWLVFDSDSLSNGTIAIRLIGASHVGNLESGCDNRFRRVRKLPLDPINGRHLSSTTAPLFNQRLLKSEPEKAMLFERVILDKSHISPSETIAGRSHLRGRRLSRTLSLRLARALA
jgi:hypothetical protein